MSESLEPTNGVLLSEAEAPSNIALIKYMGKIESNDPAQKNVPTNPSFSVTLPHLRSRVEIRPSKGEGDAWTPLVKDGWIPFEMSDKGIDRFLAHFKFLKKSWNITGAFEISSANNFPSDCGLASSASSFAALTIASSDLATHLNPDQHVLWRDIADASRKGSGSSIRSFYGPYSVWDEEGADELDLPIAMFHQAVIVEDSKKLVSSSEAHKRVVTSPLFAGRTDRTLQRLEKLIDALQDHRWKLAYEICKDEFHDMHSLFSTSQPPFSYWSKGTDEVLEWTEKYWAEMKDGPIVTMDAGPNIHFLTRPDQGRLRDLIKMQFPHFRVYSQED